MYCINICYKLCLFFFSYCKTYRYIIFLIIIILNEKQLITLLNNLIKSSAGKLQQNTNIGESNRADLFNNYFLITTRVSKNLPVS